MASHTHSARPERARSRLAVAFLLASCSDSEAAAVSVARPPVPVLPVLEGEVLRLTPEFAALIGMRTQAIAVTEVAPELYVTGVLEFDELRVSAVGARISGRIREVQVIEGTRVGVGDVLATLESAELGTAQAQIAAIEARAKYASSHEKRERLLVDEGIASQRAYELATQASKISATELRAARQRVHALGGPQPDGVLGRMALTAPIAGDVVKVHVFRGQAVEPSYTAFMIADRTTLWVRLAVFEGEVAKIRVGDRVEIATETAPNEVIAGSIAFISSYIDPATLSVEVRVIVPNEAGKLRVGQAVTARLRPGAAVKQVLGVPRAALVLIDGKPIVFVAVDDTDVIPRTVELGAESRDLVEIKRGLVAGDRVVVEGVFALKSELFR